MPNYSYKCKECQHSFEEFQSMSAEHLTDCPECNGSVKRLIGGGAGIHFKGSGFYQTDYKKTKAPCEGNKSEACSSCPKKED